MNRYYIDYIDNDGDHCQVWIDASSKDDAISQVKREYWDIQEIISVRT